MVVRATREEVVEEESVQEYVDTVCPINNFEEDLALLVKNYSGTMANKRRNLKEESFGRRKCSNYDSSQHFVVDCPFERHEDKSEKTVLNKKFNKFTKIKDDKVLVDEEYM